MIGRFEFGEEEIIEALLTHIENTFGYDFDRTSADISVDSLVLTVQEELNL